MSKFHIKNRSLTSQEKLRKRQKLVAALRGEQSELFEISSFDAEVVSQKNCENLVGSVELPVGVAGEVRLQGDVDCECLVPLATTEGALTASVARGLKAIGLSGGAVVLIEKIGMTRAPVFELPSGVQARKFTSWLTKKFDQLKTTSEATSSHLELLDVQMWTRGRLVFVRFVFDTDQAMGMNMASIAVNHVWREVISSYPEVKLRALSGNVCVDKKESSLNRLLGRGYRVQAEVVVGPSTTKDVLKTTPEQLFKTHYSKNLIGTNVAGSNSPNMQAANVAAAMFLAAGQDPAHVVEAAQAATTIEVDEEGVYAAINLPNLNLGVVGGGTNLPAFKQAQTVIKKDLTSEELAGVVAAACLAAELSGLAALAAQSLASAHQQLGR